MTNTRPPQEFKDVARVSEVMKVLAEKFAGSSDMVGMGVISTIAAAIAKLADEIETLKTQK